MCRALGPEDVTTHPVSRLEVNTETDKVQFRITPFKIFTVAGLWAACESISSFTGVRGYQNPFILMQAVEDLILKSLSLSALSKKSGSLIQSNLCDRIPVCSTLCKIDSRGRVVQI